MLLNVGQTSTITAGASSLYLLSNSNPGIANINLNTNQLSVVALAYGSTVANVCVGGSTTNCANLSITVQNSGASQQLTLSQNNLTISPGENLSIMISGGSGIYTISNNSNPSLIQASISGSGVASYRPKYSYISRLGINNCLYNRLECVWNFKCKFTNRKFLRLFYLVRQIRRLHLIRGSQ